MITLPWLEEKTLLQSWTCMIMRRVKNIEVVVLLLCFFCTRSEQIILSVEELARGNPWFAKTTVFPSYSRGKCFINSNGRLAREFSLGQDISTTGQRGKHQFNRWKHNVAWVWCRIWKINAHQKAHISMNNCFLNFYKFYVHFSRCIIQVLGRIVFFRSLILIFVKFGYLFEKCWDT